MRWSTSKGTILVLILAVVVLTRYFRQPEWVWIAGVLLFVGLFLPAVADVIHRVWMKLAEVMGAIMSRVLLTIIFFLVVLPLGLISRLLGKNDLIRKPTGETFFIFTDHTYTKEDMEHPW